MSDFLSNPEETKEYYSRYKVFYIAIAIMGLLFASRLWYLQIFKGGELRIFSEHNRIKIQKDPAPRGMIVDREGRILVDNFPGFDVFITPQYALELEKTAKVISRIIDVSATKITEKVKKQRRRNGPFKPVLIKENLTRDEVARLERIRVHHHGLDVNMSIKRSYMMGENGAQLFGYVGEISKKELPRLNKNLSPQQHFRQGDIVGKRGLELSRDRELRGESGQGFVQVDAMGRKIESLSVPKIIGKISLVKDSTPGQTLMLTIDKDIQAAAWNAMKTRERIGAAVAMDPKTGEILAWVSAPSFDPSNFSTGISSRLWSKLVNDPFKPLRNKVIQDHHSPGSTFKAIVAIAGLEEGAITPSTKHFCPGYYRFGRRRYHCHKASGHGEINVTQALERSCNVFFYKVGHDLGIDKMAKYASAMGMGSKTGIRVKNEVPGLVPTKEWKKKTLGEAWQPGEDLSNAIGQGFFLITPLQLASVFSGIANNGPVYEPRVVKKVLSINGTVLTELQPKIKNDPSGGRNPLISRRTYNIVREGLRRVVNGDNGTARWVKVPGMTIAGKTGTEQLFRLSKAEVYKKCKDRPIKQRHHGWFASFAPIEDPKLVVAIFAEHSCSGSGGAGPVAKDIYDAYAQKYLPKEYEEGKEQLRLYWKAWARKKREAEERKKMEEADGETPAISTEDEG